MPVNFKRALRPSANREADAGRQDYAFVFSEVQRRIVLNNLNDLNQCLADHTYDQEEILKAHIGKYLRQLGADVSRLQAIYDDMTSYGFLNKYFADRGNIEEIRINAVGDGTPEHPGNTIIHYGTGEMKRVQEHFASVEQGVNVLKRMLQNSNETIDELNPLRITDIGQNVRLALALPPVCPPSAGATAVIRFTQPDRFSPRELLSRETWSLPMLTGISTFLNNGVSIAFCGDTGSGKTTAMNAALQTIRGKRIGVIEDGTNDFDLAEYDESGNVLNDVFRFYTRPHPNPDYSIDQERLLDFMMKCNPDIIVVGEMVSKEAFVATEAGRTGHTVITSLHANSAADAYEDRMYTLAIRKYPMAKSEMLRLITSAFPIAVYMHQYKDGVRRMGQIVEAEGVEGNHVVCRILYEYVVRDNIKAAHGHISRVIGQFQKVNDISPQLKRRLLENGLTAEEAENVFGGELLERFQNLYVQEEFLS